MHALRRFLEDGLERRGWSQATLAREAGLSKQVVNGIVGDERTRLDRMPQDKTVDGLARAFEVDRGVVLTVIAQAMGLPVSEPVVVHDASGVADSDLLRELARRLDSAARESEPRRDGRPARAQDYAWAARPGQPDQRPDSTVPEEGVDGPGRVDGTPGGADAGPVRES